MILRKGITAHTLENTTLCNEFAQKLKYKSIKNSMRQTKHCKYITSRSSPFIHAVPHNPYLAHEDFTRPLQNDNLWSIKGTEKHTVMFY